MDASARNAETSASRKRDRGEGMGEEVAHSQKKASRGETGDDWLGTDAGGAVINKRELTRLLVDQIHRLGYSSCASQLESESGVSLHSASAEALRAGVLSGAWREAETALEALLTGALSPESSTAARWLLLRQELLERVLHGDTAEALRLLRCRLTQLAGLPPAALHAAAALLLCTTPGEAAAAAAAADALADERLRCEEAAGHPPGKTAEEHRQRVLTSLTSLLPPDCLVPAGRLERLLGQALAAQQAACLHHNLHSLEHTWSLLRDHACGPDALPRRCLAVLQEHADQVWHTAFSHAGLRLASAGRDGVVLVWRLQPFHLDVAQRACVEHRLRGHSGAATHLSWSPDDRRLLTCSEDKTAIVWDATTGDLLRVLARHTDTVSAGAWAPDSRSLYTGGFDGRLFCWDAEGGSGEGSKETEGAWRVPRVNDLAMSADGSLLACVCSDRRARLWWPGSNKELYLTENDSVTSCALSDDGRLLLLTLQSQALHLWDLSGTSGGREGGAPPALPAQPVLKLRPPELPPNGGRYVVRACLGGAGDAFVASGSEDAQVYLWHRGTGQLLAQLAGHTAVVNAVAWSPSQAGLLASASDDHTVRLWASDAMLA